MLARVPYCFKKDIRIRLSATQYILCTTLLPLTETMFSHVLVSKQSRVMFSIQLVPLHLLLEKCRRCINLQYGIWLLELIWVELTLSHCLLMFTATQEVPKTKSGFSSKAFPLESKNVTNWWCKKHREQVDKSIKTRCSHCYKVKKGLWGLI